MVRFDGEADFGGSVQLNQVISSTGISTFNVLARLPHKTVLCGLGMRLSILSLQRDQGFAIFVHSSATKRNLRNRS